MISNKKTKIVSTLGPASDNLKTMESLTEAGVNVFRLNFSHSTHKKHTETINLIKKLNQKITNNVAIMLDTKGPEIRTGDIPAPLWLKKGDTITFSINHSDPKVLSGEYIAISYEDFITDVDVNEKIYIDGGFITMTVKKKTNKEIICTILQGGELTSRRHVNLPGKEASLKAITDKDWNDINLGIELGVDYIALSFVRDGQEVKELQEYIKKKQKNIAVIAKIESFEATKNLAKICDQADGVMVARGDLGAEIPFSQIPRMQREIVGLCKARQKPVIIATHMLESMIHQPIPTRAEVTDIAEAVDMQADAVMLSGETAAGKFPLEAVKVMNEVIIETEKNNQKIINTSHDVLQKNRNDIAQTAANMAQNIANISAIVVITRSGHMANLVSGFRPQIPILAFTNESGTRRRIQILRGVIPFRIEFSATPQKTIQRAKKHILERLPKWKNKYYILVSDFLVDDEMVPTLQIRSF